MTPVDQRPDFLGIGAQKCGTTWLWRMLAGHSDVWVPPEKEIHFLEEKRHSKLTVWQRVLGPTVEATRWRRQLKRQLKQLIRREVPWSMVGWYLKFFFARQDTAWYKQLFRPAGHRVSGEITPNYSALGLEEVRWAADQLGDTKIIFVIRNPIERVWSHAQMEHRVHGRPAVEAVDTLMSKQAFGYLSDYKRTIGFWSSSFGDERFYLGLMEDIVFAPRRLVDAICSFLEIGPPRSYPQAGRAVHKGGHATIDTAVAVRLAGDYIDDLVDAARQFGGWTRWWLFAARELLERPPESSEIPYPLWKSELWERWEVSEEAEFVTPLSSGPLPAVRRRAARERDRTENPPAGRGPMDDQEPDR